MSIIYNISYTIIILCYNNIVYHNYCKLSYMICSVMAYYSILYVVVCYHIIVIVI